MASSDGRIAKGQELPAHRKAGVVLRFRDARHLQQLQRRAASANEYVAGFDRLLTVALQVVDGHVVGAAERVAGYEYQREGNPTQDRLETALAALEGGEAALAYASGMAAIAGLLETMSASPACVGLAAPQIGVSRRVIVVDAKGRQYLITLLDGGEFHTHQGIVGHDEMIGCPEGSWFRSTKGGMFLAVRPTASDWTLNLSAPTRVSMRVSCMVRPLFMS